MKKKTIILNHMKKAEDMPRVSVMYDRRKKAAECGVGTVEVMVYEPRARKRTYVSTGVRVSPDQWSDVYHVVGRADARKLNDMIEEQINKCKLSAIESCTVGRSVLSSRAMKVDRSKSSFLDWLKIEINKCKLAPRTVDQNRVIFNSLEEYGKIRRFEDVTSDKIMDWMRFVEKRTSNGKPITQVTIYGYWKRLRKWVNVAIRQRLVPVDCCIGVQVPRGRSKDREFLLDYEIEMLESVKLPNRHLMRARDLFLIQCGTGLAYSDLVGVDFTRHNRMGEYETLQGRRIKTGEQYFIVILPFAVEVLNRLGWQVQMISNQKYNAYLGTVCEIAGIDKHVTSHIGRHTYACYCLRHGVRIEAVQRTLGHSSIKTTQIYAKLVDMDVLDAFKKLS